MLPYTIAVGGQTWDSSVRHRFESRTEAELQSVLDRMQARQPKAFNNYQNMILSFGLEMGERLPNSP